MLSTSSILDTVPRGLTFLDYLGTAAFAASGCLVAGEAGMDTLGCGFVGTITALGGGTVRDLLLGRLPVFWFTQTSFLGLSIATGLITFFATESLESAGLLRGDALFIGDTLGLGAFAIVGAQAALSVGSGIAVSSLCGMLTATCGGLIRDVLCARKNQGILYSGEGEFGALYAPTALAGAAFYSSLATYSAVAPPVAILLGVGATIAMRIAAFSYRVHLPAMHKYVTAGQESAPQPSLVFSQTHLFVTAYGADQLGLVAALSQVISGARANISASKIITIGRDIAFMMVVSIPTDMAPSFRKALDDVAEQRSLKVNLSAIDLAEEGHEGHEGRDGAGEGGEQRAIVAPPVGKHYARLELLGADSPGLVSMVADFLARHSLNIVSMDTRVYTADVDGDDAGTAGAEAPNAGAVVAAAAPASDPTGRLRRTTTESAETGVSRALSTQAEGDLFCLSAMVTTDRDLDHDALRSEIYRLERRHRVTLKLDWSPDNE